MSDCHPHKGGACPADPETPVLVRYRNGQQTGPHPARTRRWESWPGKLAKTDWDIVSWRLAAPPPA